MKKLIAIAVSFMVMNAGAAFAAPEYVIKVGSIVSETHADMLAMNKVFKPQVEKLSNGRIKVELYPNAQLGGDRELCEGVQMGTIQTRKFKSLICPTFLPAEKRRLKLLTASSGTN